MIAGLKNANYLTTVIEKETFKRGTFVSAELYGYRAWTHRFNAPEQVYVKTGSKPFESRIHYYDYDNKGNLLAVSKENDIKSSYIWGYRQQHPIARAVNAETKDIFHTSFEEVDGNSGDGDSKTGKRSHIGGFSTSLNNLTNGKYLLTWWEKTGNTWNLQVNTNISVTNGEYTINLPGQIDEVRFYPATAQMSTYTYEPMVGITSECDISNRVIRYEYDYAGRLAYIRDQDNNILKSFNYQFNQPVF
jgi:YD repeat-containing protein